MNYFWVRAQFLAHPDRLVHIHEMNEWMITYIYRNVTILFPVPDKKRRVWSLPKITQKVDFWPTGASREMYDLVNFRQRQY